MAGGGGGGGSGRNAKGGRGGNVYVSNKLVIKDKNQNKTKVKSQQVRGQIGKNKPKQSKPSQIRKPRSNVNVKNVYNISVNKLVIEINKQDKKKSKLQNTPKKKPKLQNTPKKKPKTIKPPQMKPISGPISPFYGNTTLTTVKECAQTSTYYTGGACFNYNQTREMSYYW